MHVHERPAGEWDRRSFLRFAATGVTVLAGGALTGGVGCGPSPAAPADPVKTRPLLRRPATISATAATLRAAPGAASVGDERSYPAWLFNDGLPGPTFRARRGGEARIRLLNQLPEETIVHWHGLLVPESADGHPRYAIPSGTHYDYAFPIVQRAGTFWYHPHAHHRTASQIHRGLAGFFLIEDDEEDALQLPAGDREVLLLLQDRSGGGNPLSYPTSHGHEPAGLLGDIAYGNGIGSPRLDVTADTYRFRVLNSSNARVYRLGLSNGAPILVIGNDGGLLPTAVSVDSLFLGVGERIDVLIDLAAVAVGGRVMLRSLPFEVPGSEGPLPQGAAMDLLDLVVIAPRRSPQPALPAMLSSIPPVIAGPGASRDFVLSSAADGTTHQINGKSFVMDRVDEQISVGRTERWRFHNHSSLPHPVHVHGAHFQVAQRTGGRNIVYPYERGWKDTVLVMPAETVEIEVCFDRYPGLFPLHCHNLQHEDMGMMLNVEVV